MRAHVGIGVDFLPVHVMHNPAVRLEPTLQDHAGGNARRLACLVHVQRDADLGAGAVVDIDDLGAPEIDPGRPAAQRLVKPVVGNARNLGRE